MNAPLASRAEVYGFVGYLTSFVAYGIDRLFSSITASLRSYTYGKLSWVCRNICFLAFHR